MMLRSRKIENQEERNHRDKETTVRENPQRARIEDERSGERRKRKEKKKMEERDYLLREKICDKKKNHSRRPERRYRSILDS
jgi:hypothetical protein